MNTGDNEDRTGIDSIGDGIYRTSASASIFLRVFTLTPTSSISRRPPRAC